MQVKLYDEIKDVEVVAEFKCQLTDEKKYTILVDDDYMVISDSDVYNEEKEKKQNLLDALDGKIREMQQRASALRKEIEDIS